MEEDEANVTGPVGLVALDERGAMVRLDRRARALLCEPEGDFAAHVEGAEGAEIVSLLRRMAQAGAVPSRCYDVGGRGEVIELSLVEVPAAKPGETWISVTRADPRSRTASAQSRWSEDRYRAIYENMAEGIYTSSLDGVQLSANPALVALNGYDNETQMLAAVSNISREWYVDPDRREEFRRALARDGVVRDFVSEIRRHRTRERIWITENARLVRDADGEPAYYEGSVREITQVVQLLRQQSRATQMAEHLPGILYALRAHTDGRLEVEFVNGRVLDICGIAADTVRADFASLARCVHPEDRARIASEISALGSREEIWSGGLRFRRPDGRELYLEGQAVPFAGRSGSVTWHGFFADATAHRAARLEAERLAYRDVLTGLPNRFALEREIQAALDRGEGGAVAFLDLDNFNVLNNARGHAAGDLLLCAVADALREALPAGATVARRGGDEFVVLWDAATGADPACCTPLREALAGGFDIDGDRFHTTASIGLAPFEPGDDLHAVLHRADAAMSRAKRDGRDRMRVFDRSLQHEASERETSHRRVREAVEGGGLSLHYQPVTTPTGRIKGAEALLRCRHREHGAIGPVEIIETSQEIGLADRVNGWIVADAMATLARWQRTAGLDHLTLSVNVTAEQIQTPTFVRQIADLVHEHDLDAGSLILEVTEHAMLSDLEAVHFNMEVLRGLGIRFALDDFGTGYSSLTNLKQLPLDIVKIDRSFVTDIETEPDDRTIVEAVVGVAGAFGLTVTAEGVETVEQADTLREIGCHHLQGYLFGRALPCPDFEELAVRQSGRRSGAAVEVAACA